jgi:O-antigen/teichoic acid export membrane protein
MLIVLAKVGTVALMGQFALALAIVTPIIWFTNLQLRALQSTDARKEFVFADYLAARLTTATLALVTIALFGFFGSYSRETILLILAVALLKTFDSLSDVYYGLLQLHERMERIAISLILQGVLQLAVFLLCLLLTDSLLLAVLGMAMVSATVLVIYDFRSARRVLGARLPLKREVPEVTRHAFRPRWRLHPLLKLVWLGLPMGVVMGLNSLAGNIPRYLLAHDLGDAEVGIFAAIFYLIVPGSMIIGAVSDSAAPRLARTFAEGRRSAFWQLLLKLVGAAVLVGTACLLFPFLGGPSIVKLIYRSEYMQHTETLLWVMASCTPIYLLSVLGTAITATRHFHVQIPVRMLHLLVTYAFCAFFISKYGLVGASQGIFYSSIASVVATALLVILCVKKASSYSENSVAVHAG